MAMQLLMTIEIIPTRRLVEVTTHHPSLDNRDISDIVNAIAQAVEDTHNKYYDQMEETE